MEERTSPKHKTKPKDFQEFLRESKNIYELWWGAIIDGEMYVSQLFLVSQKIIEKYLANFAFPIETNIIAGILKGVMLHDYYTTGIYWESLMNRMDQEFEQGWWKTINFRNDLIAFYMEEVEDGDVSIEDFASYVKAMETWDPSNITPEAIMRVNEHRGKEIREYKFSEEGIDYVKKWGLEKDLIKWFKQIRIKRQSKYSMSLLIAVISAVYFGKELFLYYNPRLFQLGICDREGLECEWLEHYIITSFSYIIGSLFCECCLGETIKKYKLTTHQDIKDSPNLIKEMFDDLYNQIQDVCPDHIQISVKGKVNDNNRISEIDQKLPNAENIGFTKHGGKKVGVKFEIKDDLKSRKKRVKRK